MPQTHRHELRPARHLAQLPSTMVGFGQSVEIVSRNQFQKLGEYGIDVGQGSRPSDVSGVSRNNTLAIVCDAEPCDLSNHGTAVGLTPCLARHPSVDKPVQSLAACAHVLAGDG